MKAIIDDRGRRLSREELDSKFAQLRQMLGEADVPAREHLAALASLLQQHTPLSFFVRPSVADLAELVRELYTLLDARREIVAIRCLVLGEEEPRTFIASLTSDAPYLVHSLQLCLNRRGLAFQVVCHPILGVVREKGRLLELGGVASGGELESLILIELETPPHFDPDPLIAAAAESLIAVQQVRRDAEEMDRRLEMVARLSPESEPGFWDWLRAGNFVCFSYKRLLLGGEGDAAWVEETADSALGLPWRVVELAEGERKLLCDLNSRFRGRMQRPTRVVVEEVDRFSPILKDQRLTYVGCRDAEGEGQIEHAFLGLFTEQSTEELTLNVPQLRGRIETALQTLCVPPGCHDYRKTFTIFNTFPKVELFFMADGEILEIVRSFTHLYRYGSVKVVPAHSLTVRGLTLLVIMPGNHYSPGNLERMEAYMMRFFGAEGVTSRIIHFSADYVSLHVTVHLEEFDVDFDGDRLERGLTTVSRPWSLTLRALIERRFEAERWPLLWQRYRRTFPEDYQQLIHPRFALRDIEHLEELLATELDGFDLWGPFNPEDEYCRLQFYSLRKSYLNDLMPYLDNLHLRVIDEVDFTLTVGEREVFIKSFSVRGGSGAQSLSAQRNAVLEALVALRRGALENDSLSRLLLLAGLNWKQVDIFRAYRNYYFQLGSPYTKLRVAYALINNPQVAQLLMSYFEARFLPSADWQDPLDREEQALSPIRLELITALERVRDPNEDNILRILFNLIDSTVRTNYFLRRDREDFFISFKISAIGIIDMPAPRPLYETYVHSASMEGIHLRGGKVARGGIRWSDRPDDFRTEILGLMKTQMTKNALIVPVGSKGGFVVKTPYSGREEGGVLSKAAYQTLMRGLLDLCDNRVGDQVVGPEGVVAYDSLDPYLVVAADKGTAHLPDTANAVSADYGFWLKDAFASGGSKGYDHKKLGITARGAWECVKRHFREFGVDIQSQPFSVVGIGDMSGDVFGNGMLLSQKIRLLAAFDHRHIFLDPDPDPEKSWAERQRLFDLPRSSWDDYDRELISEGGGVFPRDLKDIPLSHQVREWLGVRHASIDPQGLISLLLAAPVDLLWNGGIGTYVKASSEKHGDAGDRANDALRIDAGQLRTRVIGEGGNLGLTQRARIEYALGGGRINTDAIDNSAGVDCSDHEVNLKIFLHHLMSQQTVADEAERDRLLSEVTGDVCRMVLHNNYTQSLCLSLDGERCRQDVVPFLDLAERLSDAGLLDRGGEALPGAKEVFARSEACLTRPELAILLAYSKMQLFQALLESELPEHAGVLARFTAYFPQAFQERFRDQLGGHPLKREIAATMVTNYLVDRAGAPACSRIARQAGVDLPKAAEAYLAVDRALEGERWRQEIFALDNRLPADNQYAVLLALEDALQNMAAWGLASGFQLAPGEAEVVSLMEDLQIFAGVRAQMRNEAEQAEFEQQLQGWRDKGLSDPAAERLLLLPALDDFLPAVALAREGDGDVATVAGAYIGLRRALDFNGLLGGIAQVPTRDHWDRQAAQALTSQFNTLAFELTRALLASGKADADSFLSARRPALQQFRTTRQHLGAGLPNNLHPYTVLLGSMRKLLP